MNGAAISMKPRRTASRERLATSAARFAVYRAVMAGLSDRTEIALRCNLSPRHVARILKSARWASAAADAQELTDLFERPQFDEVAA